MVFSCQNNELPVASGSALESNHSGSWGIGERSDRESCYSLDEILKELEKKLNTIMEDQKQ